MTTADDYERLWQIELAAEKLFNADIPGGRFARWLPQFRPSCPDPVGDIYRRRAAAQLTQDPKA